jgi:hypothetical protein
MTLFNKLYAMYQEDTLGVNGKRELKGIAEEWLFQYGGQLEVENPAFYSLLDKLVEDL